MFVMIITGYNFWFVYFYLLGVWVFCFLVFVSSLHSWRMCCLFYWSAQLVCSQRTSAGPGNWIPVTNRGMEVTRGWSVKSTGDTDSGEGSKQLFICCQTSCSSVNTDGLGLGKQRKKHRAGRSSPGFALCHPWWAGGACLSSGMIQDNKLGEWV